MTDKLGKLSENEIKELQEKHADFIEDVTVNSITKLLGIAAGCEASSEAVDAKARHSKLLAEATDEQLEAFRSVSMDRSFEIMEEWEMRQAKLRAEATESNSNENDEMSPERYSFLSHILDNTDAFRELIDSALSSFSGDTQEKINNLNHEELKMLKLQLLEALMKRLACLATGDNNADIFDPEVVRRVIAMSEDPNFNDNFLSILAERNDPDALETIMENLGDDPAKIPQNVRDAIAKLSITKA